MVTLVKKYGPERIIVNSAADWGVSDPLKVPKTAAAMREAGIVRGGHRDRSCWHNPVRFFAQSGRLDLGGRAQGRSAAAVGGQLGPARAAAPGRLTPDALAMRRTLVLDVVGLTPKLLRRTHAAPVGAGRARGRCGRCATITPAVTCSVQSTFTTGLLPRDHGCVANGWYFRDTRRGGAVEAVEPAGRRARRSGTRPSGATRPSPAPSCSGGTTCTPARLRGDAAAAVPGRRAQAARRLHRAAALRDELPSGSARSRCSTSGGRGRTSSAASGSPGARQHVLRHAPADADPGLPAPPRLRPAAVRARRPEGDRRQLRAVDAVCAPLHRGGRARTARRWSCCPSTASPRSAAPCTSTGCCARPACCAVRPEQMGGAAGRRRLRGVRGGRPPGGPRLRAAARAGGRGGGAAARAGRASRRCWTGAERAAHGLDHPRSGELVAVSRADRWFTYYYWLDDDRAPDYARTVDIHRKPGYDPVELFLDPEARPRRS